MMYERLSGLDALSLHIESGAMSSHALGVLVLDPSTAPGDFGVEDVLRSLRERAPASPAFRKRLISKPFMLGQPIWAEDPQFDVSHHIHRASLPAPGGHPELSDLAADIARYPLSRRRPLWEAWVVDGLADERLGLIIKVSHALTDGVGGITSLLPQLMTTDPREGFSLVAVDAPSTGLPSDRQVIGDLLHEITENTLAGIKLVAKVAPRLARSAVTGVAGALTNPTRRSRNSDEDDTAREPASGVPRTILNEPLTDRRSVAMGTVALSDMRKIAEHFETTVNDVYLACLSSALREWHRCHDRIPDGPLVGFMPISTRTEGDDSPNSWTVALIKLPMQGSDTTQRLQAITSTTRRLKKSRRSASPVNAADVTQLIPPLVARTAATVYVDCELGRLHAPLFHTLASNVPGPAADIYVAGALVERMHACAPLFAGANLSIVAVSHGDRFDLGITACPDNVPAVDEIATSFEEAVGELLAKV